MSTDKNANQPPKKDEEFIGKNDVEGYPLYPPSEDIYEQGEIVPDIDPNDITQKKAPNETDPDAPNEKGFEDDTTGGDLDIPGEELDDEQEEIGSEDEENNYYSLGQ